MWTNKQVQRAVTNEQRIIRQGRKIVARQRLELGFDAPLGQQHRKIIVCSGQVGLASQGFAVVAHTTGLYVFSGGSYTTRPISYYNEPEWKRINWNYATSVQVVDDKDRQQLYVLAPLKASCTVTLNIP